MQRGRLQVPLWRLYLKVSECGSEWIMSILRMREREATVGRTLIGQLCNIGSMLRHHHHMLWLRNKTEAPLDVTRHLVMKHDDPCAIALKTRVVPLFFFFFTFFFFFVFFTIKSWQKFTRWFLQSKKERKASWINELKPANFSFNLPSDE